MKRAVQRKSNPRPALTYLTTQEVANILGVAASVIVNRTTRDYVTPAARAGLFARALYLWTEDQLPDIRRAIIEHAHPSWKKRLTRRYGDAV